MTKFITALMFSGFTCGLVLAADVAPLITKIKATGSEGAGSVEVAAAWKQLSGQDTSAVIPILRSLNGATPTAANWLRSALDAITENAKATGKALPVAELQKFLGDRMQAPKARRLAFELICSVDPKAREEWLPKFIDDPAPELRFDAVQTAFEKAKQTPKDDPAAKAELTRLLNAARSFEQVEEIAKVLEERGEKIDLTAHFGFVKNWQVIGPFDNLDGKDFDKPLPPESKVDLTAELSGKTDSVKWKAHTSAAKYAPVDLNKVIGKNKNATAYAYSVIEAPEACTAEFRVGSATGIKVFVNGKEILARECYHQGVTPDSHIAAANLQKGQNTILLKVCQNDQKEPWAQEWQFQLRITDLSGARANVKEVPSTVNDK